MAYAGSARTLGASPRGVLEVGIGHPMERETVGRLGGPIRRRGRRPASPGRLALGRKGREMRGREFGIAYGATALGLCVALSLRHWRTGRVERTTAGYGGSGAARHP